jgi:hypothetical protein
LDEITRGAGIFFYEVLWEGRDVFERFGVLLTKEGDILSTEESSEEWRGSRSYPLILTRWEVEKPFSPWNSVLLRQRNALKHEARKSLRDYPQPLLEWVEAKQRQAHEQARKEMEEKLLG